MVARQSPPQTTSLSSLSLSLSLSLSCVCVCVCVRERETQIRCQQMTRKSVGPMCFHERERECSLGWALSRDHAPPSTRSAEGVSAMRHHGVKPFTLPASCLGRETTGKGVQGSTRSQVCSLTEVSSLSMNICK